MSTSVSYPYEIKMKAIEMHTSRYTHETGFN